MKNLKLGIVVLEGVAALISVGIGIYQVVQIVKAEKAKKVVLREEVTDGSIVFNDAVKQN